MSIVKVFLEVAMWPILSFAYSDRTDCHRWGNHLSEYLRRGSQRIENEGVAAFFSEPQNLTLNLDHTPKASTSEDWWRYRGTSR